MNTNHGLVLGCFPVRQGAGEVDSDLGEVTRVSKMVTGYFVCSVRMEWFFGMWFVVGLEGTGAEDFKVVREVADS